MKIRTFACVIMSLFLTHSPSSHADVISDWTIRHPLPYHADLWNAAYGNGVYVSVGEGGIILSSDNLSTWHTKHHPELIESVAFGDGLFTVSGYTGDILVSADGTNWTTYTSGTVKALRDIVYGGGLYVAVGNDGWTAVSGNGTDWSAGPSGNSSFRYWGVTYGDGLFVAAGTQSDYDGSIHIMTTTNGIDWTAATLPGGLPPYTELWDVAYANGRYTAVGYWEIEVLPEEYIWGPLILTSTDGQNWTRVTDPDIPDTDNQWVLWAVHHNGAQWVGAGQNGLVMTSADGLDWVLLPTPLGKTDEFYGVTSGAGETLVVGSRGSVFSTPDMSTWTDPRSGSYPYLRKIGFNGSQFIAGRNSGRALTSEDDGATWTDRFTDGLNGRITGIAYGMGRWVISSDSISGSTHFPLSTSTNGLDWVRPTTSAEFTDCRGVAFGNNMFVAIPKLGANTLAYSANGVDWTETTHPWFTLLQNRNHLAFGDDHFLSWGDSNSTLSVAWSTDGMNWQSRSTGLDGSPVLPAGTYGDGRWVLVGSQGRVVTSPDGINWSEQTITFDGNVRNLYGVAYGNGHWVIVGDGQYVWSSTDGINWEEAFQTQLDWWDFTDVCFDGESFWCVGEQGSIYQSAPLAAMLMPPTLHIEQNGVPSEVELHIGGVSGQMWNLEFKPLLTNEVWTYQTTITLTNDMHTHVQPLPGESQGFFRLHQP